MTCIAPIALTPETLRWFQPDSCMEIASASLGSTPCWLAVATMRSRVAERLGTVAAAKAARFVAGFFDIAGVPPGKTVSWPSLCRCADGVSGAGAGLAGAVCAAATIVVICRTWPG